jgi:hypothetical protein
MARVEENQRIILAILKDMPLSQINLIDMTPGIINGGHIRLRTGASEDRWMVAHGCDE